VSLKELAQEILEVQDRGTYVAPSGRTIDISEAQQAAVAGTRLYRPSELKELLASRSGHNRATGPHQFEVTDEKTQEAACRLMQEEGFDDLVLLDFASARNPGGGFLTGAKAQEEDLTRCSGLYRCLETQTEYYETNRANSSLLYTDHIIYSPRVPWFRVKSREFLESPYLASVITAPAPNAGEYLKREPDGDEPVKETLRRRSAYVLAVARDQGHRSLLLGAWGCGVFRNDPAIVADAFMTHLQSDQFADDFDRVTFAVYDPTKEQRNLNAFRKRVT
jgi:uncharacterized protein (TIGR02452 family)